MHSLSPDPCVVHSSPTVRVVALLFRAGDGHLPSVGGIAREYVLYGCAHPRLPQQSVRVLVYDELGLPRFEATIRNLGDLMRGVQSENLIL